MIILPEKALEEAKQLCCGVFWIITDNYDPIESTILVFYIPCNPDGTLIFSCIILWQFGHTTI